MSHKYAMFLNDNEGDNIVFTDEMNELETKVKFIDWWKLLEPGHSIIIKRLS